MRKTALLLLTAVVVNQPAHAQRRARGPAGLRATMAAFLRALPDQRRQDTTRRWFPTSGDWRYTRTVHKPGGGTIVEPWVVPAAQTPLLFGFGKDVIGPIPTIESFEVMEEGQKPGVLIEVVMSTYHRRWRLVRGNRFVPPGARASSPVFVEWRRERGRWVISAFGDEDFCHAPMVGYAVGDIMRGRGLPAPAEPAFAAHEPWFANGDTRYLDGRRYIQLGLPREIGQAALEPIGWHGDIRVYAEKGQGAAPYVIYIPALQDVYQPYVTYDRLDDEVCPQ